MKEVVAAVVRSGSKFLVAQRNETQHYAGLWEFPGGKVQDGESYLDAARRELLEELALVVMDDGELLCTIVDESAGVRIHFLKVEIAGTPLLFEHAKVDWCGVCEIQRLPLAPADQEFVRTHLALCF